MVQEGLHGVVVVGECQVGDGARGGSNHLRSGARRILLLGLEGIGDLGVAEHGGLEGRAGAGTGCAVDNRDGRIGAADFLPVGDFAGEDGLQLVDRQVVDGDVLVDDRAHANDAVLVVGDLLEIGGVLHLRLGEHVGVADLHRALGDLRDALAGAATLNGDLNAGVLLHELLGSSFAEGLKCRGTDSRDGAGERLRLGLVFLRVGLRVARAVRTAAGKAEGGDRCGSGRGGSNEVTAAHEVALHSFILPSRFPFWRALALSWFRRFSLMRIVGSKSARWEHSGKP